MKAHIYSFLIVAAIIASPSLLAGQQEESARKRQQHLETILRLQDLRTTHDGKLLNLLSDKDPVVRERATLAFGSIQDTSVLTPLLFNLTEASVNVQLAAAFAIGQTAGALSRKGKEALEHELIWTRLEKSDAADRLIEEIGKFGTEQALTDLVLRFGSGSEHSRPLIMSIARFGIRNITTTEAINYLFRYLVPTESAGWQPVYALQRIGNHARTRELLGDLMPLARSNNAFVRMNFATLLGKIKDEERSLEPLLQLIDHDPDWRVRVNALKALANFNLQKNPEVIDSYRRSFTQDNVYIATTALSAFGSSGVKEDTSNQKIRRAFDALRQIAANKARGYLWQVQGEAALALAKLTGRSAAPFVHPNDYPQPLLQAMLLNALGLAGDPQTLKEISAHLGSDEPILRRAALEGLQNLGSKNTGDTLILTSAIDAAINALANGDVAVVTTAAALLGDSLFQRRTSVPHLLETLTHLRVPDDVEAMQEISSTLGKLGDERAVPALEQLLASRDRSVANAAANALATITGKSYSDSITKYDEPLYVDFDFDYLRLLPETLRVNIETIRGDISMELYTEIAPFTVMSMVKLATQRGFYRGLPFHRVVPNFVIQGGDPRGDGWGGPGYAIRSEFSPLTYETGTVGIASAGKDTEGSQFFITQSPQPHLDGRYTIVGKVVAGMDVVNRILVDDHIYEMDIQIVR